MELIDVLRACPNPDEDAVDFGTFCRDLGANKPTRGNSQEWAALFAEIKKAEEQGLVETERDGRNIESIKLTDAGRAHFREWKNNRSSRMSSL